MCVVSCLACFYFGYSLLRLFGFQFLIDNNLYGMDWVRVERVKFRQGAAPEPRHASRSQDVALVLRSPDSSSSSPACLPPSIKRQSTCELECDCAVGDILNARAEATSNGKSSAVRFCPVLIDYCFNYFRGAQPGIAVHLERRNSETTSAGRPVAKREPRHHTSIL